MIIDVNSTNISSFRCYRDIGDDYWNCTLDIKETTSVPSPYEVVTLTNGSDIVMHGVMCEDEWRYSRDSKSFSCNVYSHEWILGKQFIPYNMAETNILTNTDANILAYESPIQYVKRLLFPYVCSDLANMDTSGIIQNITYTTASPLAGIYASAQIQNVPSWGANWVGVGNSGKWKQWRFDNGVTTKLRAISDICQYTSMIFWVTIENLGQGIRPYAWVVPDSTVGINLLDRYGAVHNITRAQDVILEDVLVNRTGGSGYNTAEVLGIIAASGTQYYQYAKTAARLAGTIPWDIAFRYVSKDLFTGLTTDAERNAICLSKAQDIRDLFETGETQYTIPMVFTTNIKPWERVKITGYSEIPEVEMRVTYVEHTIQENRKLTVIKCQVDKHWSLAREINMLIGSAYANAQKELKEDFFVDVTKISIATAVNMQYDRKACTARLRTGGLAKVNLVNNS